MKKILILTSNPRNDLKLDREIKDLKNVIKRSKNQSQFETEFELEVHSEELQDLLLEHEPRIVHFCGYGTGDEGLVLENQTGQKQVISTEALSNFELFENQVECAILNACYSEVQAKAIVRHINYVVGMSHEIRDDAAIAFATGSGVKRLRSPISLVATQFKFSLPNRILLVLVASETAR